MEVNEAKNNLRSAIKHKLNADSFHQSFERRSQLVSLNIFSLLKSIDQSNLVCGVFSPMDYEPNWLMKACQLKMSFALPKMLEEGKMTFHETSFEQLRKESGFSVRSESEAVVPNFLLVPGLCFSQNGERLGRGKGYYDRYLGKNKKIRAIGVCFETQLTDDVPTNDYDKSMDFIVTEERTLSI